MSQCGGSGGVRGHADRERGEGEADRRVAARHEHARVVARAARRAKVEVEAVVAGEVEASGDGPRKLVEESELSTAYTACIVSEGRVGVQRRKRAAVRAVAVARTCKAFAFLYSSGCCTLFGFLRARASMLGRWRR